MYGDTSNGESCVRRRHFRRARLVINREAYTGLYFPSIRYTRRHTPQPLDYHIAIAQDVGNQKIIVDIRRARFVKDQEVL